MRSTKDMKINKLYLNYMYTIYIRYFVKYGMNDGSSSALMFYMTDNEIDLQYPRIEI